MELHQFRQAVRHHANPEVRVVRHMAGQLYQVEFQQAQGESSLLKNRGKPQLFRSLDAVYNVLRHVGVHRAYLVQTVPHDEVVGRQAMYSNPLSSHIPLVF